MPYKKHFEELIRKLYFNKASLREVRSLFRELNSRKDLDDGIIPDSLEEKLLTDDLDYNNNLENVWSKVESDIDKDTDPKSGLQLSIVLRVAAAIALLVIAGYTAVTVYQSFSWTEYRTYYGEIKTIELNDGSVVVLNGNSVLKVQKYLTVDKPRDVYLSGEANFQVAKAGTKDARFLVHTRDLDVEVLGTRFNVNCRESETSVYLEEGSVKINQNDFVQKDIFMSPGEKIDYSLLDKKLELSEVESEVNEISWKEGLFEFEELSLDQILKQITEPYNYSYEIENESLGNRTFTVRIPTNDLEFALSVLEKLTNTSIVDQNGMITVRERDSLAE